MLGQLMPLLVAMLGAVLFLLGIAVDQVDAQELAPLPPAIGPIEETYVLGDSTGPGDIKAALESVIAAHPDAFLPGTRVASTRSVMRTLQAPAGDPLTLTLSASPSAPLMDLVAVRAQLLAGDTVVGNVALHAYFELEAPALVAARDIERGIPLTAGDLQIAWVPLRGKQAGQIATDPSAVIGLGLRSRLLAGRPLDARQLLEPELVARNALVQVTWVRGGLALRGEAKALQPGHKGETIALVNPDSGQRFTAVVTGPNTVEVR
ncbi:MAG TPA: flagellar basal body P-ring formation chaperone FlgA [bacterium]|nr:flagellar basal body P-ring formation chaperone FlgA [bacterium]